MNSFRRKSTGNEFCTVGERTWFLEDSVRKRRVMAYAATEILLTAL
jgi:hypothetical protein